MLRVLLTPRASLATEFSRPAPLSGLATWQMTFMLLVGRIYGRAVPAAPLVYAGAAAQVAVVLGRLREAEQVELGARADACRPNGRYVEGSGRRGVGVDEGGIPRGHS